MRGRHRLPGRDRLRDRERASGARLRDHAERFLQRGHGRGTPAQPARIGGSGCLLQCRRLQAAGSGASDQSHGAGIRAAGHRGQQCRHPHLQLHRRPARRPLGICARRQPHRSLSHDPADHPQHEEAEVGKDPEHSLQLRTLRDGPQGRLLLDEARAHRLDARRGAGKRRARHHVQRDLSGSDLYPPRAQAHRGADGADGGARGGGHQVLPCRPPTVPPLHRVRARWRTLRCFSAARAPARSPARRLRWMAVGWHSAR